MTNPTTGSGPLVARWFHRLLAINFLVAWASLGWQVDVLIGSRGLLPVAPLLGAARASGTVDFSQMPTLFWLDASDPTLHAGIWLGAALSLAALLGIRPRLCVGLATLLYLSYVSAGRTFLSFQWDNLLLECGALAVFLPRDRPARWIHVLFRLLLFKLYFESGIAKWQSYLGDWQDGSAMLSYYQTAPLPTWLAWYAHHLPAWWHHFESRAVLVIELLLPFGIFGPRPLRRVLFAVFTGFQLLNLATANYGFFVYLTLALHLFLLDDADLDRLRAWLPGWRSRTSSRAVTPAQPRLRRIAAAAVIAIYLGVSVADALAAFATPPPGLAALLGPLQALYAPWRLVNTYHLFGHITRERIEPELQLEVGGAWQPLELLHKPGDPLRAPDFVAPHQPRVDFQLWFYGLGFQHGTPAYVRTLLERLCHDPSAVQSLFRETLPSAPTAVRIVFWDYRFSDAETRREVGAWWNRNELAATRPLPCNETESGR